MNKTLLEEQKECLALKYQICLKIFKTDNYLMDDTEDANVELCTARIARDSQSISYMKASDDFYNATPNVRGMIMKSLTQEDDKLNLSVPEGHGIFIQSIKCLHEKQMECHDQTHEIFFKLIKSVAHHESNTGQENDNCQMDYTEDANFELCNATTGGHSIIIDSITNASDEFYYGLDNVHGMMSLSLQYKDDKLILSVPEGRGIIIQSIKCLHEKQKKCLDKEHEICFKIIKSVAHHETITGQNSAGNNWNTFTNKSRIVAEVFEAPLLAANYSQLKAVLQSSVENPYYILLLTITSLTLVCHGVFGLLMILKMMKEKSYPCKNRKKGGNQKKELCGCSHCEYLGKFHIAHIILFNIIIILNIATAGLGLPINEKDTCMGL